MKAIRLVKILSLILVLFTAVFVFASCMDKENANTDTEDNTAESNSDVLTLIEDGVSKCTVVYPLRASGKEASVAFAISSKLKTLYGVDVTVTDDYGTDEAISTDDVEILIGRVKRTEAEQVCEMLVADTDIAVAVRNNKLIIAANEGDGYDRALAYFEEEYLGEGGSYLAVPRDLFHVKLLSENLLLQNTATYTIVYPENGNVRLRQAAEQLKGSIEEYLDVQTLKVTSDASKETEYEILIGDTNRKQSSTAVKLDYYDYLIRTENNKIVVNVGGSFAAKPAVEALMELLIREELEEQHLGGLDTSLFNPLTNNQSSFVPAWQGTVTVLGWMTNFDEKLYAITNTSGRPMTVAHRGDTINYPENSLEGILSAALLGADVIELDVVLTKDNVIVLCHDSTLTRTTNVAKMKGKNGLPDSVNVCDWTYAQLQQLSLLDRDGNVTQYKIPGYYEVLKVLRGRCFIVLDAKEISDITSNDVLEIETFADALETSMYSMFVSSSSGPAQADSYKVMIDYAEAHPELTRFAQFAKTLKSYMAIGGHSIRKRGWIGGTATTNPYIESHDKYLAAYTTGGIKLMYTNNIPLMSSFIAKYQPDLK